MNMGMGGSGMSFDSSHRPLQRVASQKLSITLYLSQASRGHKTSDQHAHVCQPGLLAGCLIQHSFSCLDHPSFIVSM